MRPVDRRHDLRLVRRELERLGLAEAVRALEAPRPWASLALAALGWGAVVAGWLGAVHSAWLVLPGLALAAVGMRLLNNLLHEGSHDPRHRPALPRPVRQLLLALPLFEDTQRYRRTHLRHHWYLGAPGHDPDFVATDRRTPLGVYASFLLDRKMWRGSALGELPRMSAAERARALLWWLAFLGALAVLSAPHVALSFAGFWMLARATTLHALRVFTELTDHVGLPPGDVLGYTRTSPSNLLTPFVHPVHDNYHLAHHLFPRVPMVRLKRAHALLMHVEAYRAAPHCDGYFFGARTVARSWCGAAARRAAAAEPAAAVPVAAEPAAAEPAAGAAQGWRTR